MAMTPSRLGQVNGAGSATDLFLKKFAGEIMGIYQTNLVIEPSHMVRRITEGKSAQFPAYGTATAAYHTPGTQLTGTAINHAERVITIDDQLVADVFVANIDELMNHYDVRAPYASELGHALAKKADTNVAQVAVLAARASATVTGGNSGTAITDADADTNGASLVTSLYSAAENLDTKDVPNEFRTAFVLPAQYYLLLQEDSVTDQDFAPFNADRGAGMVKAIGSLRLQKTNNVPQSNVTTGPSAYQGNFSTTVCFVSHPSAVGTVNLLDLVAESDYLIDYQGDLMVAKYAKGHGILRPEGAVEIKTA